MSRFFCLSRYNSGFADLSGLSNGTFLLVTFTILQEETSRVYLRFVDTNMKVYLCFVDTNMKVMPIVSCIFFVFATTAVTSDKSLQTHCAVLVNGINR